jgi:predicted Zn-dependent peptidase
MIARVSCSQLPNAYGSLLTTEGGVGLNASTSQDSTRARPTPPPLQSFHLLADDLARLTARIVGGPWTDLHTEYYLSLPANKLELWMAVEASRWTQPVFRELYSEKEVIKVGSIP